LGIKDTKTDKIEPFKELEDQIEPKNNKKTKMNQINKLGDQNNN